MITDSGVEYTIRVCDPFGVPLTDASNFVSLKYSRVVNTWSTLELVLPATFNQAMLRIPDGRIEVWRNGILDTETTWLIKLVEWTRDDRGQQAITVEADTPLCVLKEPGRIVGYPSGDISAMADDAPADDVLKSIARRNIGTSAVAVRDLSAYISIAPNLSLGPLITKSYAWRDCLKVMQEVAASSAEQDVYLAFDIIAPTPDTYEFRTYIGWRGIDHRFPAGINPILIGPEYGNMGACQLQLDYRNEVTQASAGGRGEGAARLLGAARDDLRIGASPFGRRETFINATQYTTSTGLAAEAEAAVRLGRPRQSFRGKILDVPGTQYGRQWAWGDYVTVQAFQQSFDCRIDALTVSVVNRKENIDAWLRSDTI